MLDEVPAPLHPSMTVLKAYLASLSDPEFMPTAAKAALIVGSILFIINHGLALSRGEMTEERWLSAMLSYCAPYGVNIYGQFSYRRKMNSSL